MLIIPAIDLKNGNVVRLKQGRSDAETIYSDDPAAIARKWAEQGAKFLHVVDLDGAFTGAPQNWDALEKILSAVKVPVQLGGGLRTPADIEKAIEMGVSRVVVGTKACESREFVGDLVAKFGDRVVVGVDAYGGIVATKGWTERTELTAVDFAQQVAAVGVRTIVFTDIAADGMMIGPNFYAIAAICDAARCDVIASGGVGNADDVRRLRRMDKPNLVGVIIGKALYDGRVSLAAINE
jgi:phosphoribosylformimino-5-aminoimidazole carboxamide ribotide isomerase